MNMPAVTEVRSVLIPLAGSRLLLPNAVVAEVVDYRPPIAWEKMPDWFWGEMAWRGRSVPVVSFEGMLGESVSMPGRRSRIIVMNTLNSDEILTHIAMVAENIPTLVRVTAENIEAAKIKSDFGDLIERPVTINAGLALIPDLDRLESRVREVVASHSG